MSVEVVALLSKVPEISTTVVGTLLLKKLMQIYLEENAEKFGNAIANKFHINYIKKKYFEGDIKKEKEDTKFANKKVIDTLKKEKKVYEEDSSFIKYCVTLSEAYKYLPDKKLLELMRDRGCLDEEEIRELL